MLDSADKLAEPKNAGKVALLLYKLGLPELSQASGKGMAKVAGGLAPYAGYIKGLNIVWMAGSTAYETTSCYNKTK